jgi:hypothetical protein
MNLAVIYEWIANDEASKLELLREAIGRWHEMAQIEFASRVSSFEEANCELTEISAEFLGDEAFMLKATERAMCGSLSVAISSTLEKFLGEVCKSARIALSGKAMWGEKRQRLERLVGTCFDEIAGFPTVTRVRLAANCFKHRGGKVDADLASNAGLTQDAEIEYENEDWSALIEATKVFLTDLSKRIPG